jgi:phosphomevalonate kinase
VTASAAAAGPDVLARAPGKLYIAGEYAVVEPGHPAVLIAVDRVITVRLTAAAGCGRVRSSRWGHSPVTWVRGADEQIVLDHSPLDYVTSAIALMERLRAERGLAPRYFDLAIDSELDDPSGRKFGLGSSGAVTAAVVDAVGRFYGMGLGPQDRFRLALLATIAIAPRASGGDVAASTYGGWIEYTAPDRAALRARAADSTVTAMLTVPEWEVSRIRRLGDPAGLALLVGWTGRPASTEHLVARVHRDATDVDARYADFLTGSRRAVEELTAAWTTDPVTVLGRIRTCRSMLQELGRPPRHRHRDPAAAAALRPRRGPRRSGQALRRRRRGLRDRPAAGHRRPGGAARILAGARHPAADAAGPFPGRGPHRTGPGRRHT